MSCCPNCGYCPACGRTNASPAPLYPNWVTTPFYPFQNPTVVCSHSDPTMKVTSNAGGSYSEA